MKAVRGTVPRPSLSHQSGTRGTFKLSTDPRFEEKLRDVVGLYLDPPHNAAVFSFDEKSQIQALDSWRINRPEGCR